MAGGWVLGVASDRVRYVATGARRGEGGARREKGVGRTGMRGTVRPRARPGDWVGWTVCEAVRAPNAQQCGA